jgi:hypothetical protein
MERREKEKDVCNGIELDYIAIIISDFGVSLFSEPSQTKNVAKALPCLSTFTYLGYRPGPCFFSHTLTAVMLYVRDDSS